MARPGPKRHADTETMLFKGTIYRRRPGKRYFETMRWNTAKKRYECVLLHREVWKHRYGDIPPGCVIHHKDGDWNNNALANLKCMPKGEHSRMHDSFSEWNKTVEATEHHKRIAKLAWEHNPYRSYQCLYCQRTFQSRCTTGLLKYCSSKCGERYRARLRSGS